MSKQTKENPPTNQPTNQENHNKPKQNKLQNFSYRNKLQNLMKYLCLRTYKGNQSYGYRAENVQMFA